ncbi:HIRAN domain-containing protein [Stutzerimonas xanthomarina]|uniref:HIRAN domain-containing protein n=2 Tax=Stutzerimonas xanthomarina TaxID=271420 RepID=A0A1M5MRJ7_9GAMM|nr:HIRAN domain-containing protein [Stutzerimonas xanthomarina]MCP9337618.1 HIRAN domain-containing protein [Stutzerimonas xanthomarina]SEH87353.1 HIRAN domain-containing protein [Stutzerimonas xanthomarina]SHG79433.1 HIRAN domain-containing protein [Stutzerimonas xanthomarina DSM 18231]
MSAIEHIYEPSRLLLVWHPTDESQPRHRRVVGELVRQGDDAVFRYLKGTDDFEAALNEGFFEFPAFADKKDNASQAGALDVFLRRIPPRKREDFKEYLGQYNLPPDFSGSPFSLLGYTGARLASDTFELCPDLSDAKAPLDFVIELSGAHHYHDPSRALAEGDEVDFITDDDNKHDGQAIRVELRGSKIGYVNKALAPSFRRLLREGTVRGTILKTFVSRSKLGIIVLVKYS